MMARVLADAVTLGDEVAAKRHGISPRSVQRYRALAKSDDRLTGAVAAKKKAVDDDWRDSAVQFMRTSIAKLEELVAAAGPDQIREVAGAIKIVGELNVAKDVLGGEQPRSDSAGAPHAAHAGRGDEDSSASAMH